MNAANGSSGHERCGGRTRAGPPCKLPAGHGTSHPGVGRCDHHGGATPTHEEHARQVHAQQAEQVALAELATLNVPPLGNPLEQLAQLAAEAGQWKDMMRQRVAELTSLTGPDHLGDERARVVVVLLERAMDRCERFAASMARLDIDERIVKVHEQISQAQAAVITGVIERVLITLAVSDRPRTDPRVAPVIARELHAVAAGGDLGP